MRPIKMIPIHLDKPRHILLDLRAVYKVELELAKVYGEKRVSLPRIFRTEQISFVEMLHLLWAGLLHEDPNLTVDQVAKLLSSTATKQIDLVLGEALREQAGLEEKSAEDPTTATTSGTGSGSGPSAGSSSGSPALSSGN